MAGRGRSSGIELRRIVSGGPANVSKRRTLASFCIGVVPNPGIFACGCGLRMNLLAVRRRHAEERGVAWAYPHRFPGHGSGKYRRGVLVLAYRTGVQGAEHGPRNADSTLLIDATPKRPMPLLVLPARQYMEGVRCLCQQLVPTAWLAASHGGVDLARLYARRLDRHLGGTCAPRCRR
jgi:hypothetical protein